MVAQILLRGFLIVFLVWAPSVLAFEVKGGIAERWHSLGGAAGAWGAPNEEEMQTGDKYQGVFQNFRAGSVVWSPATGAHLINNDEILARWIRLEDWIGYPVSDVTRTPGDDGYFMHCQNGSIYVRDGRKAQEVHGEIRNKWGALGWELGPLGWPTTDEYQDGPYRRSDFDLGYIRWTVKEGARETITRTRID